LRLYSLQRRQTVKDAPEHVFNFFGRPENLRAVLPASVRFEILTPSPIEIRQGAIVDYCLRIHGFSVRWTSLIAAYEPSERFVDVQLRGPFSFWHHTHTFRDVPGGGTEIGDDVLYGMRFGPLGRIVHALLVRRDLEWFFDYRAKAIEQMFTECSRRGSAMPRAAT